MAARLAGDRCAAGRECLRQAKPLEGRPRSSPSAPSPRVVMASDQIDPEDVTVRRALVFGPAGMDSGVTAVESAVVPDEPVRVAVAFGELGDLQRAPGCRVIVDQSG